MNEKPPKLEKIVSSNEIGGEINKESPRLLEATFLLTQIAHMLRPQYVSSIEKGDDGLFTRDGVVEKVEENEGEDGLKDKETDKEIITISNQLERLGFTLRIDTYSGNYKGSGKGGVRHIKAFQAWEILESAPAEPELLFAPVDVRKSIQKDKTLSPEKKEICEANLNKILELYEEEKRILRENLPDPESDIKVLESLFLEVEPHIEVLMAITTAEEAGESKIRESAKQSAMAIGVQLKRLKSGTNITSERYAEFLKRYKNLSQAIGVINRGVVNHAN